MIIKFISNDLKNTNTLKKINISFSNAENKDENENKFKLDKTKVFYTTKKMTKNLSNDKNLQINIKNIENKYKLLIIQLIAKNLYTFTKYKTEKSKEFILYILDHHKNKDFVKDIIHQINITNINRDFQNEPSNIIYPQTFCDYSKNLLGKHKHLDIKVLDDKELKKQGFNLIYQLGQSSVNSPRFMIINYLQSSKYKTICLIGKGVTFDLGGVNIKPSDSTLFEMKSDKTGGCTVVALMKYIIDTKMKINVIGLIPLIENVISGSSIKPGDIVKSYNGTTVEMLDQNAEGRGIMGDALGFADTLKNIDYIMNLSTLTGAAAYYHCDTTAAILTLNKKLQNKIEEISEEVGERVYFLPPWPEYVEDIESDIANVKNLYYNNCKQSGSFMAGMFLLKFVPKELQNRWIHFDITHSYSGHLSNANTTILLINLLKYLSK